jgi:hypothetical protein
MQNFKFQRLLAIMLGMAASTALAADVSMKGDAKLSGEITGMSSDGTITLLSPISEKALVLSADQIERVAFGNAGASLEAPEQRIELSNGDIFPVRITSMDADLIHVESPVLGAFAIPRAVVSSLQLGIVPKKVVYAGPENIQGWSMDESSKQAWNYEDGSFLARGHGALSRDVALPKKFILKFTFRWQNQPNFQFCFAQPPMAQGVRQDKYIAEFSGSRFGVFREAANRMRTPVILLGRSPKQMAKQSMKVEIRVDRTRGLLELLIDGELEGRYTDSVQPIPAGTGISLINQGPLESRQSVRSIMILEWDDRGDRHRSEERGDAKADSLIGRYGERFGGELESIRRDGASTVYVFKSDFQKEPLELPEEEVSTVFMGGEGMPSKSAATGGLILSLRGQGSMRVSTCVLEANFAKVEHPLLGSLEFGRAGISSLERIWKPEAKPVNDR